jgi:C-terminal processing protease CtpA/Prc
MPKKNKRKAEEEEKEEKEEKEEEGEEDDYEDPNDGEYEEKPKKGSAKKGKKKDEDEDEKAADDDDDDSAIPTADLKKKYVTLTLVRKDDSLGLSLDNNHVTAVKPGGAAAEAGVLVGDIIVEVMGKYYDPFQDFGRLLPKKNRPVKLKVVRFVKDDGVKKPKTKESEGEASTSAETKPDETKEEPEKEAQADEAKEETKA